MTFRKRGLIVALTLAFAAAPSLTATAEAKVTKGQASVAKRSGKLYINQRQYEQGIGTIRYRGRRSPRRFGSPVLLGVALRAKRIVRGNERTLRSGHGQEVEKESRGGPQRALDAVLQPGRQRDERPKIRVRGRAIQPRHHDQPKEADAFEGLAITHLNAGNSDEGIETYKKALNSIRRRPSPFSMSAAR